VALYPGANLLRLVGREEREEGVVYFADLTGAFEDRDGVPGQRNTDCSAESAESGTNYYDLHSVNASLPGALEVGKDVELAAGCGLRS
jgi:hypothetical protein